MKATYYPEDNLLYLKDDGRTAVGAELKRNLGTILHTTDDNREVVAITIIGASRFYPWAARAMMRGATP